MSIVVSGMIDIICLIVVSGMIDIICMMRDRRLFSGGLGIKKYDER